MQGWRISAFLLPRPFVNFDKSLSLAMEDAHAIVLDLDDSGETGNTFFAVYDGHGGMSLC